MLTVQFPDEDLAARIRAARAYGDLTRRELVAAINRPDVTERVLTRFEDPNSVVPTDDQLAAIASACGLPLAFFSTDLHNLDGARTDTSSLFEQLRAQLDLHAVHRGSPDDLPRGLGIGVTNALESPIVLDGIVSDEKLSELLALGTEYPELDFKGKLDLSTKHDQVELAKDVGAMQVRGGYIVVGAKSDGTLTGELDGADLSRFDEAMLAPMMLKWLPAPLQLPVPRYRKRWSQGRRAVYRPSSVGLRILQC